MQPETIGGRYRIQRIVGRGGMGAVFLAEDEILGREVAVKQVGLLPGETVPDSARALREARSTAALSHRNVVTVYDVVEEEQAIWLVMEHVPSRSLAQTIGDQGPLDPVEVARIGAQAAEGLAAAHAAGIVHRDVKPGNILVRPDGGAKISDFGIARPDGDPALTQTNLFVGTPAYLSPEAARGQTPTPASDVWSLGATLNAAVEGAPPYETSANHLAVLNRIIEQDPPAPTRAGVLAPVLSRMLDRDPRTRWSMVDAAHALSRVAAAASTSTSTLPATAGIPAADAAAGPDDDREPSPAVAEDGDRSHRLGAVLAGLLATALAIGAALLFLDGGDGSSQSPPAADSSEPTTTPQPSEEPSETQPPGQEPSPSPERTSAAASDDGVTQFIRRYFATVPADTDTGWSMVGPGVRSQGRDTYDGWWSTVEDVEVSDIDPADSGETADVTVTYTMKDGRVETERQRLDLLRTEDGWLIDDDQNV